MDMTLRIFTEPQQGATYDDLLAVARGRRGARLRRVLPLRPLPRDGRPTACPGPTDAWITLAGARPRDHAGSGSARWSRRRRSGCPGPLAISVAQVDQMSGGRVELGLGAGWYEAEHTAYGIPFPAIGERFDRLEEQLAIITGLWATPTASRSLRRRALPARRLPGAAQAGAAAAPADHHRRQGHEAHAAPRRDATPTSSTCRSARSSDVRRAVRPGARGRARTTGATRCVLLRRRWSLCVRPRRRRGRPPRRRRSAATPTSCARTRLARHPRRGRRPARRSSPRPARPARLPPGPRPRRPRPPRADRERGREPALTSLARNCRRDVNRSVVLARQAW